MRPGNWDGGGRPPHTGTPLHIRTEIMNIRERVRGAMRRVGDVSVWERLAGNLVGGSGANHRRTWGAGANLGPLPSAGGLLPAHSAGGGPREATVLAPGHAAASLR